MVGGDKGAPRAGWRSTPADPSLRSTDSELLPFVCPAAADMGVVADLRVEGVELNPADRAGLMVNLVI